MVSMFSFLNEHGTNADFASLLAGLCAGFQKEFCTTLLPVEVQARAYAKGQFIAEIAYSRQLAIKKGY